MEGLTVLLQQQGENPMALQRSSWKGFGTGLSKDMGLSAYLHEHPSARSELKKVGGIVALWRHMFPRAAQNAALRYGAPSQNDSTGPPPCTDYSNTYQNPMWSHQAFLPQFRSDGTAFVNPQWSHHTRMAQANAAHFFQH
eukprot:1101990-Karenia_brevis.AAC.1